MMMKLASIGIAALLGLQASPEVERIEAVRYEFGVDARNQYDSRTETYVKDMVCNRTVATARIGLTSPHYAHLFDVATAEGFFELPEAITPSPSSDGARCVKTPCEQWKLMIVTNRRSHQVSWTDCECVLGVGSEHAAAIAEALMAAIRATPEFQRLPRQRCFYM